MSKPVLQVVRTPGAGSVLKKIVVCPSVSHKMQETINHILVAK